MIRRMMHTFYVNEPMCDKSIREKGNPEWAKDVGSLDDEISQIGLLNAGLRG